MIAENAAAPAAQASAQDVGAAAQAPVSALSEQVTPETVENATETASSAAWGTLLALLLGLGAALLGTRHECVTELQTV